MPAPSRIEAFAIISADGMIADAAGHMPDALKIEADQQFFHAGLDRAAVVVHGRRSHEGGPNAARRRRLIVTSRVPRLAPAPAYPHALFWNPIGALATMPSTSPASRRLGFPAAARSFAACQPFIARKMSWRAMGCALVRRRCSIRRPERRW